MEANTTTPPTEDKSIGLRLRALPKRCIEGLRQLPATAKSLPAAAKANPKRAAIYGAGVVGVFALLIGLTSLLASFGDKGGDEISLQAAFDAFDKGEMSLATSLANQLVDSVILKTKELGGPPFILGMVQYEEAVDIWDNEEKLLHYAQAARWLEEARDRGFPPDREKIGLHHLALSLFYGEKQEQAAPILKEALALQDDAETVTELTYMLSLSYLRRPNPQFHNALAWNKKYLEYEGLSEAERYQAWLEQGKIYIRLGDVEQARARIEQIPESAQLYPQALVILGQMLITDAVALVETSTPTDEDYEARQRLAREKLQQAIATLRNAEARDTLGNFASQMSKYLIGVALHHQEELPAALDQLKRTIQLHDGTAEAIAAMVEQADVLRKMGENEKAVKTYEEVLQQIAALDSFINPWLSLDEIYDRVETAYHYFFEIHHYEEAYQLAITLAPSSRKEESSAPGERSVFESEDLRRESIRSVKMQVLALEAWANHIMTDADVAPLSEAEILRKLARTKYREAGTGYARLAKLRYVDPEYPDDIWLAADNYRKGHDFQHAAVYYEFYLSNVTRPQRSTAMLGLGESQLALEREEEAINTLHDCIATYPLDPISYRARLLCSRAHREAGQSELARALLEDNLNALTPQSLEWRDSLFELATTLYEEGLVKLAHAKHAGLVSTDPEKQREAIPELEQSYALFQEAINRFNDASRRYPDAPQFILAKYHLAESHRYSSWLPEAYRHNVAIESTQNRYRVEAEQHLERSLVEYITLQEVLISLEDEQELDVVSKIILKNCYFARGTVLYQLRRYEEAIRAFGSASSRYQREPVALEAQVQIASCHHQLGQPVDAQGSIEHAILILDRIPKEADFTKSTRYSREEWSDLLAMMKNF